MEKRNPGEYGFLLLTSTLGCPDRKPLTVAQFRTLTQRAGQMPSGELSRDVNVQDFVSVGYSLRAAQHIVELLQDEAVLDYYLVKAKRAGCVPITRATESYPLAVRKRLGLDSPGCLWAKGNLPLLDTPMISLVGSRELSQENQAFAEEVGRQAALQGFTLVSGNARGADKTAQDACLSYGGSVVSIVADSLAEKKTAENVLYLSEDAFDAEFSAQRALSRNRCIHALGAMTFVAQCSLGTGGTWDGTVKNLRQGWNPVYCFDDGSRAVLELEQMGAQRIGKDALGDFCELYEDTRNFLDP